MCEKNKQIFRNISQTFTILNLSKTLPGVRFSVSRETHALRRCLSMLIISAIRYFATAFARTFYFFYYGSERIFHCTTF